MLDHINELSSAYECSAWSDRAYCDYIDTVYNEIVSILNNSAETYVPEHRIFFKFWWDEELRSLKSASVDANKLWKAAGKPRYGSVYWAFTWYDRRTDRSVRPRLRPTVCQTSRTDRLDRL